MSEQATGGSGSGTVPTKRKHDVEKAARHTCERCHLSAPGPIVKLVAAVGYACGNHVACEKRQRKLVPGTVPTTPEVTKRVKKPKGAT